jgi:Rad3-related DNA helicase
MLNLKHEISREPPKGTPHRTYGGGEPILYAFNCALLEKDTGMAYIYTAVNLMTGATEMLSRRKKPLTTSQAEEMADRIRRSRVAGAGRLQAERPVRERLGFDKARELLNTVFRKILPQQGFTVRKEQIALAEHILAEISKRGVTLAEAEVGTGKTLGYLVPAILAKRGRLNDFWNNGLYPKMQYADMSKMPIVIATSSIALQRALLTEYIPDLSRILLESGVITTPLTAVLRKGKEHYVCERNLRAHLPFERDKGQKRELERLLTTSGSIDLADAELSPHTKRKVSVSGRCMDTCPYRGTCEYMRFRAEAQNPQIDIQVCNHNYLLADTLLRAKGQQPLIPNYQILIVDEAHKFLQAARTMYGLELSSTDAPFVLETVDRLAFKREGYQSMARQAAKKLSGESAKLFRRLTETAVAEDGEDEADRFSAMIGTDAARHLRNIRDISERLLFILRDEAFYRKAEELLAWVRDKYGVNTSRLNLRRLLTPTCDADTRELQKELMHGQVLRLHKAICELPEIVRGVTVVRKAKKRRNGFSPERELLRLDTSVVREAIWRQARRLLPAESATGKGGEWLVRLIWDLENIHDQTSALAKHGELICWLELDKDNTRLCAIPKDLDRRLFNDQWSKGISTVLTSGTLSAGGDFSHIKRTLGLERLAGRLSETSKPSPFNHREIALLYISETMPFPDRKNPDYIEHTANEIEKLVRASHGHAAVLFTSYKVMDMVWELFEKRGIPFPLFRLDKGGVREIERFKHSDGGVLFASGALWEGIDIPGDALSMLIIVKLPFAVPDPIGEYEKTLYKDMNEYKARVIVPEMLIKLKQGFGRLIRTEKDTGCVAILDSRVNSCGNYRSWVLHALPDCRVTAKVTDTEDFIRAKKNPKYFKVFCKRPFSQLGKRGVLCA